MMVAILARKITELGLCNWRIELARERERERRELASLARSSRDTSLSGANEIKASDDFARGCSEETRARDYLEQSSAGIGV